MSLSIPLVWSDAHRLHDPGSEIWVGVKTPAADVADRAEMPEATLDGSGTVRGADGALPSDPDRLRAWGAVTLAYLAGLADGALALAVEHARSREQFGASLGTLPAVQARLADAAVARDSLLLCAWSASDPDGTFPGAALAWAGTACREVTAHVQQVHGGIGFALEGGVHRFYRRAKTVQVWADAVLRAVA